MFLWPTGMVQVFNGTVDDGYNGLLGWVWIVCAVTTIGLVAHDVVRAAGALLLRGDGRDRVCSTSRSSPPSAPTSSPAPSSP